MTEMPSNEPLSGPFEPVTHDQWLDLVTQSLKGGDFEKRLVSKTRDGIRIAPLYPQAADAAPIRAGRLASPWAIAQRVDHPDAKMANELALADLEQGAATLILAFPETVAARGFGLEAGTVADLDAALANVSLDMISLRVEPGPRQAERAKLVAELVAARGFSAADISIAFGLDPFAVAMSEGGLPAAWADVSRDFTATIAELRAKGFGGALVSCDTRPVHEAGGTEAQELAAALAMGVAYLRALSDAGMPLAEATGLLSWTIAIDADQFAGIAKLRALRQLWARIEAASGLMPKPIHIHAETAWRMMTRRDPAVNMLRTTMATFVAATGGADSLSVLPYTLAAGLPTGFARRVARNTQNVLMEESNLWRVADPAAGAGAYEALTDALCEKAWALFQEIEGAGGMAAHLASGAFQKAVAAAGASQEADVARRKIAITGTSEFPNLAETPETVLDVPRSTVTSSAATAVTFPALQSGRIAEPFEALRDAADVHAAKSGAPAAVFLANLGPLAEHNTRAMWITNLLAAGGIGVVNTPGFTNSADVGKAFAESGAKVACICGTDATYGELAEAVAEALKGAGAVTVLLAGRGGDQEAALKAAGVDGFAFAGMDVLAALTSLHGKLGIGG